MVKILILFVLCAFTICQGKDYNEYEKESDSKLNEDYYLSQTKESYYEALQICQEKSMQLVSIENKRKNRILAKKIRDLGEYSCNLKEIRTSEQNDYWTSGNNIFNNVWYWLKGEQFEYENWIPANVGAGSCLSVREMNNTLFWKKAVCDSEKLFICEHSNKIRKECEQDDLVTGYSNKDYYISEEIVTYYKAIEMCRSMCMNLLSIEDKQKNNDVYQAFAKAVPGSDRIYWSSGYYKPSELSWYWENGEAATFFSWSPREPNNARENEYCIEIYMKNGTILWNDEPCQEKRMFVCESK